VHVCDGFYNYQSRYTDAPLNKNRHLPGASCKKASIEASASRRSFHTSDLLSESELRLRRMENRSMALVCSHLTTRYSDHPRQCMMRISWATNHSRRTSEEFSLARKKCVWGRISRSKSYTKSTADSLSPPAKSNYQRGTQLWG
jgi:hypothetical protein